MIKITIVLLCAPLYVSAMHVSPSKGVLTPPPVTYQSVGSLPTTIATLENQ